MKRDLNGIFAALVLPLEAAMALLLALMPMPAKAYTPTVCHYGRGYAVCQPVTANPSAHVIQVEPADADADGASETREAWKTRCRPALSRRDALGMQRWTYAERGCEFGPE